VLPSKIARKRNNKLGRIKNEISRNYCIWHLSRPAELLVSLWNLATSRRRIWKAGRHLSSKLLGCAGEWISCNTFKSYRPRERGWKIANFRTSVIPGSFYEGTNSTVERYLQFVRTSNGKPFTKLPHDSTFPPNSNRKNNDNPSLPKSKISFVHISTGIVEKERLCLVWASATK